MTYRPDFRSQFDDPTSIGKFEKINCVFASGAMAMDRATLGDQTCYAGDLRRISGTASLLGADLSDLAKAYDKVSRLGAEFRAVGMTVEKIDIQALHATLLADPRAAVVVGRMLDIPAKYHCSCRKVRGGWSCYEGMHGMLLLEARNNVGVDEFLVYDPECRSGQRPGKWATDLTILLDPAGLEGQGKWIPLEYMQKFGEAYLGLKPNGDAREPGLVKAGLVFAAPPPAAADADWTSTGTMFVAGVVNGVSGDPPALAPENPPSSALDKFMYGLRCVETSCDQTDPLYGAHPDTPGRLHAFGPWQHQPAYWPGRSRQYSHLNGHDASLVTDPITGEQMLPKTYDWEYRTTAWMLDRVHANYGSWRVAALIWHHGVNWYRKHPGTGLTDHVGYAARVLDNAGLPWD